MKTTNNILDITAQKTVVQDPKESRNSIRPLLEQAGFWMKIDTYFREIQVLDGKEQIARILWIKWNSDILSRSNYSNTFLLWSDVQQELFSETNMQSMLDLGIGKCSLRLIDTLTEARECNPSTYREIYTKYPKLLTSIIWQDTNGPSIQYSDSPDTKLADLRQQFSTDIFAWWEIVQTGKSIEQLWLRDTSQDVFYRDVSTQLYATPENMTDNEKQALEYFSEKLQQTLTK